MREFRGLKPRSTAPSVDSCRRVKGYEIERLKYKIDVFEDLNHILSTIDDEAIAIVKFIYL